MTFTIHFHHRVLISSSCDVDDLKSLIKERDSELVGFGKEEASANGFVLLKDNGLSMQRLKIWDRILEENDIRIRIENIDMIEEEISNDRELEE